VAKHLKQRESQLRLRYVLGLPAAPEAIVEAEARLGVALPAQVARFYRQYDGLRIDDPPLDVLPLAQLAFVAPQRLHFATVDGRHALGFNTAALNAAAQWDIVTLTSGYRITLTMASFWSNKLWAWLDQGRPIWMPELPTEDEGRVRKQT
jgi:cell wall assembly regulator SMI1